MVRTNQEYTRAGRWLSTLFCLYTALFVGSTLAEETPRRDYYLERRIVEKKIYQTRPQDTLERVAHLLYGHRTWWVKIRDLNPGMKNVSKDQRLEPGTKLSYMGPHIGREYVVQP